MLPTIAPAALGWSRSDWPRLLRGGLLALAAVAAVAVVLTLPGLSLSRRLLALVLYLLLCPVEVALLGWLYAPTLSPGSLGRPARFVPVLLGALLTVGLAVLILGVRR